MLNKTKEKFFHLLAEHYWAVILALLVGLISIAPLIYFMRADPHYAGIGLFASGGEFYYMDRMQEAYDGHLLLGNPFFAAKNVPFLVPGLSEIIVAGLARLFFMSIPTFNLLSKFIFPVIIFLLIYYLTFRLYHNRRAALLAACLVLLGFEFFEPSVFKQFFDWDKVAVDFLAYSRPISPQINCFFLFLPLLFGYWLATKEFKNINWKIIGGGILFGLSFYVYIYFWTFLLVFFALYGGYWLLNKNWQRAKAFFTVVIVGLIVSIPYWIDFWLAIHHPAYADAAIRVGLFSNHSFVFSKLLFLDLLAILFIWPPKYQAARIWSLIAVLASWVVINQQVITGRVMLIGHYHWYIVKPLTSIIFAICLVYMLDRVWQFFFKNDSKKYLLSLLAVVILIVVLFGHAVMVQARLYQMAYPSYDQFQRYGPVIDYLNKNWPAEKTVWAPALLSDVLPAFSRHNSINSRDTANYLVTTETLKKQVFLENRLKGVTPGQILSLFEANAMDTTVRIYQQGYLLPAIGENKMIPSLAQEYGTYYQSSLKEDLAYFQTDLIVWDAKKDGSFSYVNNPLFKKIKDFSDGLSLYEIVGR